MNQFSERITRFSLAAGVDPAHITAIIVAQHGRYQSFSMKETNDAFRNALNILSRMSPEAAERLRIQHGC